MDNLFSRNTDGCIIYNEPMTINKSQNHINITQLNKNLSNINNELKEQIKTLNEKIEQNKYEILLLKQSIKTRNRKIENFTEEINKYKKENKELTQQIEIQEISYQNLLDSKNSEINSKDLEISDLVEKIRIMNYEDHENSESYALRKKYGIYNNGLIANSKNNLYEGEKGKKFAQNSQYEVRSQSPTEKTYTWLIDDVHNKREIGEPIKSDYFYARMNPYRFQMVLVNYGTTLKIRLLLHSTESDSQLNWPLNIDVKIKIINNNSRGNSERLRENRCFQRPQPNSFLSSEAFVFSYLQLFSSRLLEWDMFTIECYIAIK